MNNTNPPKSESSDESQHEPLDAARLLSIVYEELRALAGSYLRSNPQHTLQPTALVHEAYLKLHKGNTQWVEESHFVAIAATAMRQILVDHARAKTSLKRGGSASRANISVDLLPAEAGSGATRDMRVLELDELLGKLAIADARASRVAELRLFGGMEQRHIAEALGIARSTVANDWAFARAWLASQAQENAR